MSSLSINSFDDIRKLLKSLPGLDEKALSKADIREPQLTKPPGSLGRLEEISHWLAAWQGRHPPQIINARAQVFAGNHGIAQKGVSAYPSAVTEQMVGNFLAGGAAVNQLCKTFDISLKVDAMELNNPTADFTEGPAMSEFETIKSICHGMSRVDDT